MPAEADRNLIGTWVDARTGRELPAGPAHSDTTLVVATTIGSTTCTEDNATVFLSIAWPVGTESSTEEQELRFVRDTRGSLLETNGPSDLNVSLPKSARPTGFQREGNTISVDPKGRAAYVTRPDGQTERWARLKTGSGCAF